MIHKKISELPEELRPYEKCESMGAEYLSDPELLAVIIRTGTAEGSSLELAEKLLYPEGMKLGFNALMCKSIEDFKEVNGIGRVKALQLTCLGEICRRMSEEKASEKLNFTDAGTIADFYMPRLRYLSEEEVHMMFLDTRNRLIKNVMVSRGTVNCSAISPREIFIAALKCKAASFIMIHNHPSGDPEPSNEDIQFSKLLKSLGSMMNIGLLDSIVIGDNTYASLSEKGLI